MDGELESLNELRLRKFRKAAIVLTCLFVVVGLPAAWFGPPLYSRWEQKRLTRQARDLMAQMDYRSAAGRLRRVFGLNPDNIEASRLMADLADKAGAPGAVGLHRRVCALLPNSFDDAFAWASAALNANDLDQAGEALAILRRTGPEDVRYYETAGRIATASGRPEEAGEDFAEALRIDPDNVNYQLESAANEVRSKDAAKRARALKKLDELSANPAVRLPALRALADDALRQDQIKLALFLGEKIATDPKATFSDRLAYLGALRFVRHPLFSSYLAELENSVKNNAENTAALLSWMNSHSLAMVASSWISTLPAEMISKPPAAGEVAQSYLLLLDWKRLRAFASGGDWGGSEFIRQAFLARALRETGDVRGSQNHWNEAVSLASKWPPRLPVLERICTTWDWDHELEELLWLIAGTSEKPGKTLQLLAGRYESTGDTRQLNRVWAKVVENNPSDTAARNNLTMTSLLLDSGRDQATKDAAELAAKNPSNPDILSTYAFALHFQNRIDQGLELMRGLKPEELLRPPVAACYGILLADKGSADAAKYLDIAKKASLLPEEKKLVEEALAPAVRSQAQPAPPKYVPRPIAEPSPFKYVLHPSSVQASPSVRASSSDAPIHSP